MPNISNFPTLILLLVLATNATAFQPVRLESISIVKFPETCGLSLQRNSHDGISSSSSSRRDLLQQAPPLLSLIGAVGMNFYFPQRATAAVKATGADDGNLPDIPTQASQSYLQYRFALQAAADYYVFELQDKVADIDEWGDINQAFQTNNNKGQGQPNKVERDFTNPMRIIGLSMLPDEMESMRNAQYKFEASMLKLTKAVKGVRRDLPVEIDKSLVTDAKKGWEGGRVALNEFFTILNTVTGLNEMKLIPAAGPDQVKSYGRSSRRYNELAKKTKLCQNRGGPALSQAWGQLMVSGYLQENMDSCGIPDPVEYFYQ